MKKGFSAVGALIFYFGFYLQAQQNPPKITLVPVAGPVYMLQGGGGDIDSWGRQLDIILGVLPAETKVIPGHGPLAGVAELKAFRAMLADSADIVRKQMKAGKTLEEIKAAGLPESLAPWANGFMKAPRWLELVYRSLEKGPGR